MSIPNLLKRADSLGGNGDNALRGSGDEQVLCKGPGGRILWEFLGGDVPLGLWNP